jgi:hypothetical protein
MCASNKRRRSGRRPSGEERCGPKRTAASASSSPSRSPHSPTRVHWRTYLELVGAIRDPSGYFGHRGWALGWGLGCSIGVKLAWPDRPVLAILGEGSAMYGIQGLWTAAKYRIPVTFLICNNAEYQILKAGARNMKLPRAAEGRFEGMDLAGPEVDLVSLARSLGDVPIQRSSKGGKDQFKLS